MQPPGRAQAKPADRAMLHTGTRPPGRQARAHGKALLFPPIAGPLSFRSDYCAVLTDCPCAGS
eukprot:16438994-Heterocapsa_arctica.AAC.1